MKTMKNLLNADGDKTLGNHYVTNKTNNFGHQLRAFTYFSTVICLVNDTKKTFTIDDSWGSQSTTRACNAYRRELTSQGYEEVKL